MTTETETEVTVIRLTLKPGQTLTDAAREFFKAGNNYVVVDDKPRCRIVFVGNTTDPKSYNGTFYHFNQVSETEYDLTLE